MRRLHCIDNRRTFAARADGQQEIPFAPMGVDVPGEDLVVAVIIGDASHMTHIADGRRGQSGTVVPKPARQFFGKMHGVAHRAAVAAGKNPMPSFEGNTQIGSGLRDRLQSRQIAA